MEVINNKKCCYRGLHHEIIKVGLFLLSKNQELLLKLSSLCCNETQFDLHQILPLIVTPLSFPGLSEDSKCLLLDCLYTCILLDILDLRSCWKVILHPLLLSYNNHLPEKIFMRILRIISLSRNITDGIIRLFLIIIAHKTLI